MYKIMLDDPGDYLEWRMASGSSVEILDIAVHSVRGCGKGTQLIKRLLDEVPQTVSLVWAITRISNDTAHKFYENRGFRIIGRLHNFYRDNLGTESALVYGMNTYKE